MGFGKTILAAAFNLFYLTAITNIFAPVKQETEDHQYDNPSAPEKTETEVGKLQIARIEREMYVMTFHPYLGQGYRMERTENPASVPPQNNSNSANDEAESKL